MAGDGGGRAAEGGLDGHHRPGRPERWLLAVAAVTLVVGLVGVLDLTLIPRGFDDEEVGAVVASNDGPEFVTLYTAESGIVPTYARVVDRAGGRQVLRRRPRLAKEPWSRTLRAGDVTVDLAPPAVAYEYLGVLAAVLAGGVLRWSRRPGGAGAGSAGTRRPRDRLSGRGGR